MVCMELSLGLVNNMSRKNNISFEEKKMCGLWHAHVALSEYNDFGKCDCLDCFGGGCHNCRTYLRLSREVLEINELSEKTRCDKCLGR